MHKLILTSIILWLTGFTNNLCGQNIRFDHFDTRDGLSQNNIHSLIVDSTGYIWIGTLEGITRFDGINFETFRSFPSKTNTLKGNYITRLSACPNGNVWIHIRNKGLNLYDSSKEEFQLYNDSCFIPADISKLSSMVSPSDSVLWFTDNSSLYRYSQKQNITEKINSPFSGGRVVSNGNHGLLFWGDGGIFQINKDKTNQQIYNSSVNLLSRVYNDSLCVFYSQTLQILDLKNQTIIPLKSNEKLDKLLESNFVYSIAAYKNEIWLGHNNGLALVKYDENKILDVTTFSYDAFDNYSFHGKDAINLVFDDYGNLWAGTSKYGINLYDRRKNLFDHHQISVLSKSDQEIDPVRAICKTKDNNTWLGFDRLGLVKVDKGNNQILYSEIHFHNGEVHPLENIRSIYEDSHGNLWIGTSLGLGLYNKAKDEIQSIPLFSSVNWDWPFHCYFMEEFSPGELTVTGPEGIGVIDLQNMSLQVIPMPENYITSATRDVVLDSHLNYWFIADDVGLCKLTQDGDLKYFTHEADSLTDNKLYAIELIGDTLWIGSNTGLMSFNIKEEKIINSFFETDGLSNNLIYSIIKESDYLWMSTNRGLSRFNLIDYSLESFLPDDLFMDDAFFKDDNGIIYFGGYDGFISFSPEVIQDQNIFPKIIINELYVNNQKVNVGQSINGKQILAHSLQYLDDIQMDYSTNNFSLNFDAFPFNYPDETYFRYRLKGLSSEWIINSKNESRAIFTNLPPGEYIFEVEASYNKQDWSAAKQLSISIVPPFYMTMWFKILMVLIITSLVIVLFKARLYTIKKWNIHLETQIKKQTKSIEEQKNKIIAQKEEMVEMSNQLHEADQAKLKFYTNISHEFRTPLTIIMGNIEKIKEQGVSQLSLKNITRSSDRLLRLVNQFIDLRKYDQGELKLEVSKFDIVSFTKEIADSFNELALRKNINIEFLNSTDKIQVWLDKDKTDKIIYNLLSNAIKYTDEGGSIIVNIFEFENNLSIKITDNGCGISIEEQEKIFKRFYRSEKISSATEGHGMGLALVKALVELQKGEIKCTSEETRGTTFEILFKMGKSHFKSSEILSSQTARKTSNTISDPKVPIQISSTFSEEILIVEDNPDLQDYLINLLGSFYKIKTANNGKEALRIIEKNKPDLIITDLMMPIMDGITLINTLKSEAETCLIPVIILSAKADIATKIEGYNANVDDYIEKPFNPNLLVSRIQNILKKRTEIKNNIDQFTSNQKNDITQIEKQLIEKIMLFTEMNYASPEFNADVLSTLIGMSRVTLYRKMKNIYGEGPGEYIRKYRLQKAAGLIREGNKMVNEISSEVGFQSLSNFRKSFKEQFGVSPSKFE